MGLLFLLIVLVILLGSMAVASIRGAPWVPTRTKDLARLVDLAEIRPGEIIYELGSGDGRILFEIAKRHDADVRGLEISVGPYLFSRIKLWVFENFFPERIMGKTTILFKNFYVQDLRDADIVICFLMPFSMARLRKKFEKELKPGARVIVCAFPLERIPPDSVSKPDASRIAIYRYRMPWGRELDQH